MVPFRKNKRIKLLLFVLAVVLLLSLVAAYQLPSVVRLQAPSPQTQLVQQRVLAPSSGATANIMVVEQISSHYSLFDLHVREHVIGNMTLSSLDLKSNYTLTMITSFSPSNIKVLDTLSNGSTVSLPVSIQKGVYAAYIGYQFTLLPSSSNVTMKIDGTQTGEGFIYRQVTYVPTLRINGLENITSSINHQMFIAVPPHSHIEKAYTYGGPGGPGGFPVGVQKVASGEGYDYYTVASNANSLVIQSIYYFPVTTAILVLSAIIVMLSIVGLIPAVGKKFAYIPLKLDREIRAKLIHPIILPFISKIRISRAFTAGDGSLKSSHMGRNFIRKYLKSKNLLVLFVLCGILMAALATAAGPAPQFKAYVIADPGTANQIHTELQSALGIPIQMITPAQDYTDFQVMSNVGMFNVVVVSSYSNFTLGDVARFVTPSLSNVHLIIIDNGANQSLATQIRLGYPQEVVNVQNVSNLNSTEINQIISRVHCCAQNSPNVFGLHLSSGDFTAVLATEGALSLILVYLGWAFLAAKAVEATTEDTLTHMVLIIALGVFVFFFAEMCYVVTSTILRFPISLHAVISGAENITATAILGKVIHVPFGGGSTPRDLAATLGIFVGALGNGLGTQFSKKSLIFFIGLGLILYLNPLVIGQYIFQFVLLFFGNVSLGPITSNVYSFKDFLYSIGTALGGSITPVYLLSAGKMAYFAGVVILALLKRMGRNTATLALVLAAMILGHGGLRVGEMTPDKTVIAVLPGILAGVSFGLVFLLISVFERQLTSHYSKPE